MDSFGTKLKREREKQKVTLDDVSISTKIGTRFLQALENDRFQELPGGIFNKGFVRAYARHLGLDEDQILADFAAASGDDPPKQASAGEAAAKPKIWQEEEAAESGNLPWGYLVVALILVGFGLAFWGIYTHEKQADRISETSESAAAAVPPPTTAQPVTTQQSPSPTQNPPAAKSAAVAPGAGAATSSEEGVFTVSMHLREDTWISITTDGESVARGILPADSKRTIHGRNQIVIRTGNAGATDLAFDGSNVPIAGAENEVKTFTFDSHGLRPAAEPASPQP